LVLADVQDDALDRAAAELRAAGAEVLAVHCDVRDAAQVQSLADAAMKAYGSVHLVFNNAGVGAGGLIWESTQADWEWILGVNLWGVAHGVRIFTPLMLECARQQPGYEGHIVNTASMAGLLNAPNLGVYNVSKHAVMALSETLHHDLRLIDAPIGASVLCPYFVPTGIARSERNRPDELRNHAAPTASQLASRAFTDSAMTYGKLNAADIAQLTFDAIRHDAFYIFPHPKMLDGVRIRMDDILQRRNPSDPFAAAPHLRDALRAGLKHDGADMRFRIALGDWNTQRNDARAIRHDVFVVEQRVPVELEWDDMDALCVHAVAYDHEGNAIGTARLLPDGHIGRMAVLKVARGAGVGSAMLTALMREAARRGHGAVLLHAQTHAEAFYRRHEFEREGDVFMEAGIPHVRMRYAFRG
jgi:NAD(P)-dependent dehydrogenase (short-subunit alcohol dehydrogenase family)/predicted GNAT family N-acyltransferase